MNAKKLLIVATLAILLGQMNLSASETATMASAQKELTEQIYSIVKRAPFELLSFDSSDELNIKFKVDENGELSSIEVDGRNDSLAHYVKMKMEKDSISADTALAGNKCSIPVSYNVRLK